MGDLSLNVLTQILSAWVQDEGFPHPSWERIWSWVDQNVSAPERQTVSCDVEREWLSVVAGHLGGNYRLRETDDTFFLSELLDEPAEQWLRFVDKARAVIAESLEGAAAVRPGSGKLPVLLFTESDDYYAYISHHYPDGQFAASA